MRREEARILGVSPQVVQRAASAYGVAVSVIEWAKKKIAARKLRRRWWGRYAGCASSTIGGVLLRDEHSCAYCGRVLRPEQAHLDHVIPRLHGGRTVAGNLVVSCVRCNLARGSEPIAEEHREEVARRLVLPIDREVARAYGDELYPTAKERRAANVRSNRERRARQRREVSAAA